MALVGSAAFATAFYSLFFVQVPAFQQPELLDAIPGSAAVLDLDMGNGLTLVAAEFDTDSAEPGDLIPATLYWHIDQPIATDLPVSYELVGRKFRQVGQFEGYHGRGQFPTTFWPVDQVIAEEVGVLLSAETSVPTELRLFIQVADGPQQVVSATKAVPDEWPEFDEDTIARLGDGIVLQDAFLLGLAVTPGAPIIAQPGESVKAVMVWQVTQPVAQHLTTFVHVLDENGQLVAQADSPPLNGDYPTTWWDSGERFGDKVDIVLPDDLAPGSYSVWLGMYDSATVARLPLFSGDERRVNDVIQFGRITIPE
jgi:hypothetical protein